MIVNQSVSVKATLTANNNGGSYSEKHTLTTNQYGLFSLVVGKGTVLSGNINTMAWSNGVKLTVEFDPLGGTNFQFVSTTDLTSVPYAMMADSALKVANMPKKLCDLQLSTCNQVISDVSTPVASSDAVNKAYMDAILARVKYLESVLSITYPGTTIAPTTVTDIDGNVYSTIKIGNQVWMKENLRVMRYADGRAISSLGVSVYNNNSSYAIPYGRLYNWASAMDLSQTYNTATWTSTLPRQGACPTGWHLPSDAEWFTLENFVDNTVNNPSALGFVGTDVCSKLKESGTMRWTIGNTGINSSNFTSVGSGCHYSPGYYLGILDQGYFWTSNSDTTTRSWCRTHYYNQNQTQRASDLKTRGFSVRCKHLDKINCIFRTKVFCYSINIMH